MGKIKVSIIITPTGSVLKINGKVVRAAPGEICLLEILLMHHGRVLHDDFLIERMWPDPDFEPDSSYNLVKVYISKLRTVLAGIGGIKIENVHGHGYRTVSTKKVEVVFYRAVKGGDLHGSKEKGGTGESQETRKTREKKERMMFFASA